MSTMSQAKKKMEVAAPSDGGEDDDDIGALIYRESQLRKAEAAAAVAEGMKTSSASTHHRTSAGKRSSVNKQGDELFTAPSFHARDVPHILDAMVDDIACLFQHCRVLPL